LTAEWISARIASTISPVITTPLDLTYSLRARSWLGVGDGLHVPPELLEKRDGDGALVVARAMVPAS
jgi:hypothetical protein